MCPERRWAEALEVPVRATNPVQDDNKLPEPEVAASHTIRELEAAFHEFNPIIAMLESTNSTVVGSFTARR